MVGQTGGFGGRGKGVTEGTGIREEGQMTALGLSCSSKKSTANQTDTLAFASSIKLPASREWLSGHGLCQHSSLQHNLNQRFFDLDHLTINQVFQQQTPICGDIALTIPQHKTLGEAVDGSQLLSRVASCKELLSSSEGGCGAHLCRLRCWRNRTVQVDDGSVYQGFGCIQEKRWHFEYLERPAINCLAAYWRWR